MSQSFSINNPEPHIEDRIKIEGVDFVKESMAKEERELAIKSSLDSKRIERKIMLTKIEKAEKRCPFCKCLCGCHPCKHTKLLSSTTLSTKTKEEV